MKNKNVWGMKKRIKNIIEVKQAAFTFDLTEIVEKYDKFFGFGVPIRGYLVTTLFSMINDDGKYTHEGIVFILFILLIRL